MIICPNCGAEISESAKFCRKCGTKIEAAARAQQPDEMTVMLDEADSDPSPAAVQTAGKIDDAFSEEKTSFADAAPEETSFRWQEPEAFPAAESAKTDDSVEFDWNQPVEVHRPEIRRPAARPEAETASAAEAQPQEEGPYDWAAPTGAPDPAQGSMPPVYVGGGSEEEYRTYESYDQTPPWDHTAEFSAQDISDNKVTAMAAYLLGPLGIIIALLAAQHSPYAAFHVRQGLKYLILEALTAIVTVLLCWTFIIPAAGGIFLIILTILKVISFFSVCKGRAVEPPIIRSMGFLK